MNNPSPQFEVITNSEGDDLVLALRGNVRHKAAFQLRALLDAVIDGHPTSLVLDLTDLESIGAAGIVSVANAEKRLAAMGTTVTVRSGSELVSDLSGPREAADVSQQLDKAGLAGGHLGSEQVAVGPRWSLGSKPEGPTAEFRRMTAMPSDPDVVDGALSLVGELARALVEGADGVSVSLQRHGRLSTVAASDQTIMDMDADQYSTGEGPCVDASVLGRWFHAESLDMETRWPVFTPQARGLGIKAILSSPLTAFEEPVGALNIYSRRARAFDIKAQRAAAVFAKKASVILSDAGAGMRDTQMAFRYQEALQSRKDITLATGVLMEREGGGEEEAFADLLRLSLSHGEPLRTHAVAVLRSAQPPQLESETSPRE
jgi:anti-anti-sigma factor